MKSTAIAAMALIANSQYASAAPPSASSSPDEYKPLVNPGTGKCITLHEYLPYDDQNRAGADTYKATTGSCNAAVKFKYNTEDKTLQTPDGYCLSALDDVSNKEKGFWINAGLEKCTIPPKSRMQWEAISNQNQWKNVENKMCLDSQDMPIYATLTDTCDVPLPASSGQQFVFQGDTPVPAPLKTPVAMTCREYAITVGGDSKVCPKGFWYDKAPASYPDAALSTCDGSASYCRRVCCKSNKYEDFSDYGSEYQPALFEWSNCGEWHAYKGGFGLSNTCMPGFAYDEGTAKMPCDLSGMRDKADCRDVVCCKETTETQTCAAWQKGPEGFFTPGECPEGTVFSGNGKTCKKGGSDCVASCCVKADVPPPKMQSCATWFASLPKKGKTPVGATLSCNSGESVYIGDKTLGECQADGAGCMDNCCVWWLSPSEDGDE